MTEIFRASRTKIKRASGFIDELGRYAQQHAAKAVTAKFNWSVNPPVVELDWDHSDDWQGVIIGDAVHNLRTALDLMATDLCRDLGENPNSVYFPFSTDAHNLDDAIKAKNFHRAGKDAEAVLRKFEPHKGGNDALRALHDLDIQDKHKSLIVAPRCETIDIQGSYDITDPRNGKVTAKVSNVYFTFPNDSALAGQPVLETLKGLVDVINSIVEAFACLVQKRKASRP